MSSLVSYEYLIDSTTTFFIEQTQRFFVDTGRSCDFTTWLQFYAFDVIGELTWSQRIGFLEGNRDIDGIVRFIGDFLEYASVVSKVCPTQKHATICESLLWLTYRPQLSLTRMLRSGRYPFWTRSSTRIR
jgi:hypothetical protein